MFAVSFPASNPLWRPELALVEYSPKKSNDHPEGPEPLNEGNIKKKKKKLFLAYFLVFLFLSLYFTLRK